MFETPDKQVHRAVGAPVNELRRVVIEVGVLEEATGGSLHRGFGWPEFELKRMCERKL